MDITPKPASVRQIRGPALAPCNLPDLPQTKTPCTIAPVQISIVTHFKTLNNSAIPLVEKPQTAKTYTQNKLSIQTRFPKKA